MQIHCGLKLCECTEKIERKKSSKVCACTWFSSKYRQCSWIFDLNPVWYQQPEYLMLDPSQEWPLLVVVKRFACPFCDKAIVFRAGTKGNYISPSLWKEWPHLDQGNYSLIVYLCTRSDYECLKSTTLHCCIEHEFHGALQLDSHVSVCPSSSFVILLPKWQEKYWEGGLLSWRKKPPKQSKTKSFRTVAWEQSVMDSRRKVP